MRSTSNYSHGSQAEKSFSGEKSVTSLGNNFKDLESSIEIEVPSAKKSLKQTIRDSIAITARKKDTAEKKLNPNNTIEEKLVSFVNYAQKPNVMMSGQSRKKLINGNQLPAIKSQHTNNAKAEAVVLNKKSEYKTSANKRKRSEKLGIGPNYNMKQPNRQVLPQKFELNNAYQKAKLEKAQQKIAEKEEKKESKKNKDPPFAVTSQYVALHCEMLGTGYKGKDSSVAQCCITDWFGNILYKANIRPPDRIRNYRSSTSEIKPEPLNGSDAVALFDCQKSLISILKEKVLVGYSLQSDLKALLISHPKDMIRDIALFRPFMEYINGALCSRSLKSLTQEFLGTEINSGESDLSENAIAAMNLFKLKWVEWERSLKVAKGQKGRQTSKRLKSD